ncbi:hypothetical protein GUJ93_ZPchr0006g45232 [Zizania palustris]|uniref:Uncharacterized protein n=1 Tax=Zizania palustris TaxID=103762 RepID=A0A8J5TGI1_ZIZPA|nr:hypothetical protein GUJ93_ZPchr0006g45232 [Zizania palustris]
MEAVMPTGFGGTRRRRPAAASGGACEAPRRPEAVGCADGRQACGRGPQEAVGGGWRQRAGVRGRRQRWRQRAGVRGRRRRWLGRTEGVR